MKKVVIFKEKIPVVLSGHPWIFSGAVSSFDLMDAGELCQIVDPEGNFLAQGYANPNQSLFARILSYKDEPIEALLEKRFHEAILSRKNTKLLEQTNAYRLINSEGDRLGGLIVDVYKDGCVLQVSTCGIERLKPLIIEKLIKLFDFKWIYERSDSSSREKEGLEKIEKLHFGTLPKSITIFEDEVLMDVDVKEGQKTGFFIDQRPMRQLIGKLSNGKNVLNVFSYIGGFSLHALKACANSVTSVDVDKRAIGVLDTLISKNNLDASKHRGLVIDAFKYLEKEDLSLFDLIILDPPAFAKARKDVDNASKGYKKLFKEVLSKMKDGAILYAASCSYFIDEMLFEKLLIQAAMESKTVLKLISKQIEAFDHPRLLSHKEGSYLKGFVVQVYKS